MHDTPSRTNRGSAPRAGASNASEGARGARERPRLGGAAERSAQRGARPWGAALSLLWLLGGCYNLSGDCELNFSCPCEAECGGAGGTGGTGGTTVPPECVPGVTSGAVDDTCGVFVSAAGNDTNPGTKDAPLRTLGAAVAKAREEGKPVYACTNGFTEALVLDDDATIYGGLDCGADWTYGTQKKTPWTAEPGAVPLRLAAGARAKLFDLAITAADASAPGASSIAVFAEVGTQLELGRCDVTAGNGAEGAEGEPPVGTGTVGMDGGNGSGGCDEDVIEIPGGGGQLVCDPTNVAGGDGGNGTKNMTGGDGSDGEPAAMSMGLGGSGQKTSPTECTVGGDGTAGMTGAPGAGAPASLGTLGASGHSGVAGEDGQPGLPGQGGGGGGGGRGCANMKAGPSGGGGGSGGCGGAPGKGGHAGGSSIALLSLGSKLTFDTVKLTSKSGGKGGAGGMGQPGGTGGNGGAPGAAELGGNLAAACAGGNGGDGGGGGRGGGGLGGHSFGLAYVGQAPDVSGATITVGAAGNGGDGEGDKGMGAPGVAAEVQGF